jgi:hypothetical protein
MANRRLVTTRLRADEMGMTSDDTGHQGPSPEIRTFWLLHSHMPN